LYEFVTREVAPFEYKDWALALVAHRAWSLDIYTSINIDPGKPAAEVSQT
jgi:hypothetical protein